MTAVVVRQEQVRQPSAGASRSQVLARYRHLREISKRHHSAVLKFLSADAVLHNARRLGLAYAKTLVLDGFDHLSYAFDLAIHTSWMGRSRAIDRYARSARLAAGSDDALVLEAMRNARFCVLAVERRHEAAGLIVTDLSRHRELWLMDEGLEISLAPEDMLAARLYTPQDFAMTAGVVVPFDGDLLQAVLVECPQLGRKRLEEAVDDRRFAEAMYRIAFASSVMERIAYQDPEPAGGRHESH